MGKGYSSEAGLNDSTASPNCFLRRKKLMDNRAFVFLSTADMHGTRGKYG